MNKTYTSPRFRIFRFVATMLFILVQWVVCAVISLWLVPVAVMVTWFALRWYTKREHRDFMAQFDMWSEEP